MTSREPQRCREAVQAAILATAWLLVTVVSTMYRQQHAPVAFYRDYAIMLVGILVVWKMAQIPLLGFIATSHLAQSDRECFETPEFRSCHGLEEGRQVIRIACYAVMDTSQESCEEGDAYINEIYLFSLTLQSLCSSVDDRRAHIYQYVALTICSVYQTIFMSQLDHSAFGRPNHAVKTMIDSATDYIWTIITC